MEQYEHTALETRLEVQKLKSLPAMSLVVNQFLDACTDRDVGIDKLANIIEKDPALLARIIGVANSAYFSPNEPVITVKQAIFQVLGVDATKNLALAIVLSGPFDASKCRSFPLEVYWLESILCAVLAHDLATGIKFEIPTSPSEAYLVGLLHTMGMLALVHLYPEIMDRVISDNCACCTGGDLLQAEWAVLHTDHNEVGAWLGRKWHLPENIVHVMEHYMDSDYRGSNWQLVKLIQFCSRWAAAVTNEAPEDEWPDVSELAALRISEKKQAKVFEHMKTELDSLRVLAHQMARG